MEIYLEQGEVSAEQLHAPFEQALREGHLIPVCFASARTGAGVGELLDVIASCCRTRPRAIRRRSCKATATDGAANSTPSRIPRSTCSRTCSRSMIDPYVGKVGGLPRAPGHDHARHAALHRRRPQAVQGRPPLSCCRARNTSKSTRCVPGDIGAIAKVDEIQFDAVLHDSHDEDHIHLRSLEFPDADVRPRRRAEEAAATSRGSPTCCTSSRPRTRACGSSTTRTTQRDGDARPGRAAPAHHAREDAAAVQAGGRHQAAEDPLPRDDHARAPRATPPQEADRRRGPVRRGVPARSSRSRAARASSSSTR